MREKMALNTSELSTFCNQSALLLQAGITPAESMRILLEDAKSPGAEKLLKEIYDVCKMGEPFYVALESTKVFPTYVIHMIQMGEESGNLDVCMMSLYNYYEKELTTSENIRSAVTYPFVMIAMMMVVIFVLIGQVMPIFNQVFEELGSEMTGFAASLLTLGNQLNSYSLALILLLVLFLLLYIGAMYTHKGRKIASALLRRFPLTKSFFESIAYERFANGLALCLSSGLDTFGSLDMVKRLVNNAAMEEKIDTCKKAILEGDSFAQALVNAHIFNHLHSQMVGIGFRSGNIDTVLLRIADSYEKETDRKLQTIIAVLEPTLVIILSIIVGMILLSVILPLMGIMTSIG